jgi:hypothetical protein
MRIQAALPTIVVMAACVLSPAVGYAQSSPSAEQIVKSLTPTSTHGATRGIRVGSTPPAQVPSTATDAPAVSLTVQFGRALTDRSLVTYRFRIEGHTDTVGTSEQNKALSDRRAAAVVDYLADKFHVDRSRVQAVGMGKDGLLIPTGDQTPEPRNRRVQVVNLGS